MDNISPSHNGKSTRVPALICVACELDFGNLSDHFGDWQISSGDMIDLDGVMIGSSNIIHSHRGCPPGSLVLVLQVQMYTVVSLEGRVGK